MKGQTTLANYRWILRFKCRLESRLLRPSLLSVRRGSMLSAVIVIFDIGLNLAEAGTLLLERSQRSLPRVYVHSFVHCADCTLLHAQRSCTPAAQQLVAADTLIEDSIVSGFRLRSFRHLSGASFHPRAAELGGVGSDACGLGPNAPITWCMAGRWRGPTSHAPGAFGAGDRRIGRTRLTKVFPPFAHTSLPTLPLHR